jgi:hypothetical protein
MAVNDCEQINGLYTPHPFRLFLYINIVEVGLHKKIRIRGSAWARLELELIWFDS